MTESRLTTGLLVKHYGGGTAKFIRWLTASLREAGLDGEGYYLKVDGMEEISGKAEQLYLFLNESDVADVISQWKKIVDERGSRYAKFCLENELPDPMKKLNIWLEQRTHCPEPIACEELRVVLKDLQEGKL